jgi:hypothetical protein
LNAAEGAGITHGTVNGKEVDTLPWFATVTASGPGVATSLAGIAAVIRLAFTKVVG